MGVQTNLIKLEKGKQGTFIFLIQPLMKVAQISPCVVQNSSTSLFCHKYFHYIKFYNKRKVIKRILGYTVYSRCSEGYLGHFSDKTNLIPKRLFDSQSKHKESTREYYAKKRGDNDLSSLQIGQKGLFLRQLRPPLLSYHTCKSPLALAKICRATPLRPTHV